MENKDMLINAGQEHVLRFWDKLSDAERLALEAQISKLDFAEISRMQQILSDRDGAKAPLSEPLPAPVEVLTDCELIDKAQSLGDEERRLARGAVGLVAGGQGSRLGFEVP